MKTHRPDAPELLRWWHQHQAQKLNRVADHIRNGLLQELFAIRRQLEVSCETEGNAAFGCDHHLANLERLYHQLEHLSHDLNSPFRDSLPLALQHAIQPWHQQLSMTTEFPSTWPPEPVEHVQLLITFVDSFFSQLATNPPPDHWGLELTQQTTAKELICYATGDNLSPRVTESILPLLETFRLLTQGEYHQTVQPQLIRWELRWHSPSTLSSIASEYSHDRIHRTH
ncbi:hypothetical protein [Adonisia turfae]|uniref:Uncharacterized protein n=1 Tax=Adonisia turfae CCMR0081 TaxID=2292702 RepID=A0A6M0RQD6_9CYAN|nr:hypothetical protein [Adonisia turfae]NEZ58455.1 hypothetical protein [Adonisia turfae CCMR0081]